MHSSRMRTVRSSSHVYPSMHWAGGVSAQEGCLPRGVCIIACTEADTPPPLWTEFLTHACENVTLPQLVDGNNKGKKLDVLGLLYLLLQSVFVRRVCCLLLLLLQVYDGCLVTGHVVEDQHLLVPGACQVPTSGVKR